MIVLALFVNKLMKLLWGAIMKKEIKCFAAGVITTVLVTSAVYATPVGKNITAFYNGIKIYVDGDRITPKDGNGKIVEPFIYDGTTYLPVRAVSEALGKQVTWDEKSNSVYIGQRYEEVVVDNAEDFVKAIGSNKKIILKPGIYDLSSVSQDTELPKGVTWVNVDDGQELNISKISNLIIEGSTEGKTEIVVKPRFAEVMRFKSVDNVTIRNITAGHTPAEYICDAGVLGFQDSEDIKIDNCELYGCGSIGLVLSYVNRLDMTNSNINHCSLRAVQIYESYDVKIRKSKISNHEAYSDIIFISNSKDVLIEECEMSDNNNLEWCFFDVIGKSDVVVNKCKILNNSHSSSQRFENTCLFAMVKFGDGYDTRISVKDTEISNNVFDYLTDYNPAVTFENCTFTGNSWTE